MSAWDFESVVDRVAAALRSERDALRAAQEPRGIDFLTELEAHPLIRAGLESAWGVQAEVRYPSAGTRRRRSEGERCDIVLTGSPGIEVAIDADAPLFGERLAEAEEALWLEVKVVAQHVLYEGYTRPNPNYSSELLRAVMSDVSKLSREPRIAHGAVLLVLFAQDRETAEHDLAAWYERAVAKGGPVSAPQSEGFAVPDLIGNGWCTVALVRVHNL